MGLVVDEIVDVVEDHLNIELGGACDGMLGTAVIAGHATDVIDTSYWLTLADPNWFEGAAERGGHHRPRLLVVEDSQFFRQMIVPVLQSSGYDVTAVPDAARALSLRENGTPFDAIVSDIEMPDMDGFDFVRAVRASGPWQDLPVIALSGRVSDLDVETGREAGFTDYVGKFAKDALLLSLQQCLSQRRAVQPLEQRLVA
jgi:two-component system chemotaxis sensor kinase CheA